MQSTGNILLCPTFPEHYTNINIVSFKAAPVLNWNGKLAAVVLIVLSGASKYGSRK